MREICGDNRFEIIAQARKDIIESTNIESSEDEMNVLDNILFRCWQMGWLDRYDDTKVNRLKLVQEVVFTVMNQCKSDTNEDRMARNIARFFQNALDGSSPDFEFIERSEEQKTGHWIGTEYGYADGYPVYDVYECSECGMEYDATDDGEITHNYCPNCGVKMERSKE